MPNIGVAHSSQKNKSRLIALEVPIVTNLVGASLSGSQLIYKKKNTWRYIEKQGVGSNRDLKIKIRNRPSNGKSFWKSTVNPQPPPLQDNTMLYYNKLYTTSHTSFRTVSLGQQIKANGF